jgi:peptidoglycan biosynthesis protein MviN/MurJ (putative lipid II flippase)
MVSYGIQGLATSSMISSALNLILLLIGFRIFIGNLMVWKLVKSLFKFTISGAVMALVIQCYDLLITYFGDFFIVKLVCLCAIIGAGIVTYFYMTSLLRAEEYELVFANIQKKLFSKFSRKK